MCEAVQYDLQSRAWLLPCWFTGLADPLHCGVLFSHCHLSAVHVACGVIMGGRC